MNVTYNKGDDNRDLRVSGVVSLDACVSLLLGPLYYHVTSIQCYGTMLMNWATAGHEIEMRVGRENDESVYRYYLQRSLHP